MKKLLHFVLLLFVLYVSPSFGRSGNAGIEGEISSNLPTAGTGLGIIDTTGTATLGAVTLNNMDKLSVKVQLDMLNGNKMYYYRVTGQLGEMVAGRLLF